MERRTHRRSGNRVGARAWVALVALGLACGETELRPKSDGGDTGASLVTDARQDARGDSPPVADGSDSALDGSVDRATNDSPASADAGDVGGDHPSASDGRTDGAIGLDANPDSPANLDARDASPADLPLDSGTPLDAGVGHDLASFDGQSVDTPSEIAARQTVRLTVASARAAVAVTTAYLCAPFTIERKEADGSWRNLVLGLPFQCGCECPRPGSAHPTGLATFVDSPTVTWDARELVVFAQTQTCPGGPSVNVLSAVAQPVPPGHYRATIAVLDNAPAECTRTTTTRYTCQFPNGEGTPPTDYSLCAHDRVATAELDLPASGDVDVYLPVGGP